MFTRLFGKPKQEVSTVSTLDKLSETLELLEKKEHVLSKKAAEEVEKAKAFTRAKNKRAAIQCLKRKRLYEQQIEQLGNFQLRIHDQEIIEMDQQDEASVREEIYGQLKSAYSQEDWVSFSNSARSRHSRMHSPFVSDLSEPEDGPDLIPGIEEQPLWPDSYGSEVSESTEGSIPWTPLTHTYARPNLHHPMERQPCPPVRYNLHEPTTAQGKLVTNVGQSGELLLPATDVEVETKLVDESQDQLPNKNQNSSAGSSRV